MFSIIIPTYNRNDSFNMALKSIKENFDDSIDKIIIIDDGSKIPIKETIDYHGMNKNKFKLIRTKNKGPAHSRNMGIKNAKSKYLIFLDDDCTLGKNFIKNLKKVVKSNKSLNIIESHFLDPNKNNVYNLAWHLNYLYRLNKAMGYKGKGKYVNFLGNCYIIKNKMFNKIGLFDERFRTREDADFVIRAYKKSIPIVLFYDLKIKHNSRSHLFATLKQFYGYGVGQVILNKKWGDYANKIFYFNILDFLNYLKDYNNIHKIKYALVIRNIGYQAGIIAQLLKSFQLRKSLNEFLNILLHIKKVYVG